MTQTFGVNANNDIFIGSDTNLVIVYDLQATLEACAHAMKATLGEMVLAVTQGIPYFQSVWNGVPNIPQFEVASRQALLNVEGVVAVQSFTTTMAPNNVLTYIAVIQTVYGTGTVTNNE